MDLKSLKRHLGILTICNFEEMGFVEPDNDESVDGLVMRVTSNKHNKEFNEVMWASSVNNDNGNFAMLLHAILYDKETAEELGRPAEVAQVFMNKEKATIILDTIRHAFPDLIEKLAEIPLGGPYTDDDGEEIDLFDDETYEEDTDFVSECGNEESCDMCGEPLEEIDLCDDSCDVCGEPLEPELCERPGEELQTDKIPDLEGYGPRSEEVPSILNSDQIIDAHLSIKDELRKIAGSESSVKHIQIAEPYQHMYLVSEPNKLVLTFDELDIVHQMKEAVNEPLLIKEDAAKVLLNAIFTSYPHLKK